MNCIACESFHIFIRRRGSLKKRGDRVQYFPHYYNYYYCTHLPSYGWTSKTRRRKAVPRVDVQGQIAAEFLLFLPFSHPPSTPSSPLIAPSVTPCNNQHLALARKDREEESRVTVNLANLPWRISRRALPYLIGTRTRSPSHPSTPHHHIYSCGTPLACSRPVKRQSAVRFSNSSRCQSGQSGAPAKTAAAAAGGRQTGR